MSERQIWLHCVCFSISTVQGKQSHRYKNPPQFKEEFKFSVETTEIPQSASSMSIKEVTDKAMLCLQFLPCPQDLSMFSKTSKISSSMYMEENMYLLKTKVSFNHEKIH